MEVENNSSIITAKEEVEEEEAAALPGFRFHPTDEELVGFYLRRKVEKKPIRLELIKLVDIYKFDPWDLPKTTGAGEREWYFFCRRGRKYKNSIRPNRVTRSGFWKATGIDRPIYSGSRECIGLKKSLVYYRGSAGKGTKTEWMMHEFRLPAGAAHEAEVWTLCRILKRSVSYRKFAPDWREMAAAKRSNNNNPAIDAGSKTCSVESSCDQNGQISSYISFTAPAKKLIEKTPVFESFVNRHEFSGQVSPPPPPYPSYMYGDIDEFLRHADWEDLRSVVDCAAAVNPLYCDQFV